MQTYVATEFKENPNDRGFDGAVVPRQLTQCQHTVATDAPRESRYVGARDLFDMGGPEAAAMAAAGHARVGEFHATMGRVSDDAAPADEAVAGQVGDGVTVGGRAATATPRSVRTRGTRAPSSSSRSSAAVELRPRPFGHPRNCPRRRAPSGGRPSRNCPRRRAPRRRRDPL